jgi:hypothetical protein
MHRKQVVFIRNSFRLLQVLDVVFDTGKGENFSVKSMCNSESILNMPLLSRAILDSLV